MMKLVGIDLAVPKDTELNRKPKQQVANTKSDPPPAFSGQPVKHPRRRGSGIGASVTRNELSTGSLLAENKDEIISYSLGGEANIEDMAPYVPEEHVLSVGRLLPNDFAFIRRSGGKFCIAMVKSVQPDPEEGIVMDLFVNEAGATKSIPMSEWDSYIRPVKPYVICVSRVRGLGKNNRSNSLQDNGNRRASCPESELNDCQIDEPVQHVKGNKSGCKQASDEHNEVHSGSSANPTRSLRDSKSTVNNSPNEDEAAPKIKDPSTRPSSTPPNLCARVNEVNCPEDKRGSLDPGADININADHATVNNLKEPERQSSNNTCDTMNSSLKLNEAPNHKRATYISNSALTSTNVHHATVDNHKESERQSSNNTCDTINSRLKSNGARNRGTTLKSSLRSTSTLKTSYSLIDEAIPAIKEHANDNGDLSRHVQWDISFQSQNENQSSSSDISKTADSEATSDASDDEDTDSSDSFHHQPISSRRPFIMRRSETEHEADGRSYLYKQEVEKSHKRATCIGNSALTSTNVHHATVDNHKESERQSSNNTCDTINSRLKSNGARNRGTTLKSSLRSTSTLKTSYSLIDEAIPAIKEHANDNGDLSRHVQWDISFQSQNENQSSSSDISKTADSEATSDASDDEDTDSSDSFHHQPISSRRPFIMRRSKTEHEADGRSYLYKQEVERSHNRATYISNSALASATTTRATTDRNNSPLAKQKHSRRATTTDIDNSTPPKETQSRRASAGDAGDISKRPQRRGSMRNSMRGSLTSQNSLRRGLSDSQMFNESQLLSALASIRTEEETFDC